MHDRENGSKCPSDCEYYHERNKPQWRCPTCKKVNSKRMRLHAEDIAREQALSDEEEFLI